MENISNQELRKRLLSFGYTPPPVTDTSRNLLLKKLKKLELSNNVVVTNNTTNNNNNNNNNSSSNLNNSNSSINNSYYNHDKSEKPKKYQNSIKLPETPPGKQNDNYSVKLPAASAEKSVTRQTRNTNKTTENEKKVNYDSPDSALVKNKGSPTYSETYSNRTKDPFEQASDSDDSVSYTSRNASSASFLGRKPLSHRRESEYFSTVRPSSVYRKLESGNGVSSYLNRDIYRGKVHSSVGKTSRFTKFASKISMNKIVPSVVLFAFVLFFILIAGIYFTKDDRISGEIIESELKIPLCALGEKAKTTCISKDEVDVSINCLKTLYRTLSNVNTNQFCGGKTGDVKSKITGADAKDLFMNENRLLRYESDKMLENVKVLTKANPQLSVTWQESANSFLLDNVELPWRCAFKSWFALLIDYAVYAGVTLALLFSMHILFRWGVNRHQARTKGTQDLIKGILEILQQNAITNPSQSYLPIVHVRDQLITFADRERKKKMWADAVKYVEENESRIRKEIQPFQGEEYDVWRWVGGHQLSPPKPKTWQGEAFETSKDTMNTPSTSPTPCLKIRHMFDPKNETANEDWVTGVKDAILERCEGVNVIHMVVDETSSEGCVYIKCASTDDAGKAYRKMHGAWFDGKIVSVKYLRLERYHERFPSSLGLTKPLIPSNDQKRSIV